MALENLIQVQFTDDELTRMDASLREISSILNGKTIKLSPEERRQYGSIAEQNKLFVNKSKELMEQYPQYVPQYVDKSEFDRDFMARNQIEGRLLALKNIFEQLSDTKVLLDHDNYTSALSFYRNIRYLNGENTPGIKSLYEALKQFFKGRPSKKNNDSETFGSE